MQFSPFDANCLAVGKYITNILLFSLFFFLLLLLRRLFVFFFALYAFPTIFHNPIITLYCVDGLVSFFCPATSQHFGFVGSGTLLLLNLHENGTINQTKAFEWSDGLFDTVSVESISRFFSLHFVDTSLNILEMFCDAD